ncbi:MAG: nitrile hydratase subunit beta [Candidatus Binatia bacterium]
MNGVHDLGGMDGFGPVVREHNEPVFHADWERQVFGMMLATMGQGFYNLDEIRHAIERMSPAHYLGSTYYEHWLAGLERILAEKGRITPAEIEARLRGLAEAPESPPLPERPNPALADGLAHTVSAGAPASRGEGRPRYRAGAAVRVLKMNPSGHTRCPRYVRGMRGTVERVHEKFILPDAHAHGRGERPEVLYTIGFEATELWGKGAEGRGRVYVDLWESYLEPAGAARTAATRRRPRRPPATRKRKAKRR